MKFFCHKSILRSLVLPIVAIVAVRSGHLSAAPRDLRKLLRSCVTLLTGRMTPESITENRAVTEEVDLSLWNQEALNYYIGRSVMYLGHDDDPTSAAELVGPVVFHRLRSFSTERQKILDDIILKSIEPRWLELARIKVLERTHNKYMSLARDLERYDNPMDPHARQLIERARNPDTWAHETAQSLRNGIEVGKWLVSLKNGQTFESDFTTSFLPNEIDYLPALNNLMRLRGLRLKDLESLEFFHTHPGDGLVASALSPRDISFGARIIAQYLDEFGFRVGVHIFAVGTDSPEKIVCHFSTRI